MGKEATPQIVIETPEHPVIAEMLANTLMECGIPAFVEGSVLQDPYAVTQRALGNLAIQVIVPEKYAAEARGILDNLRSARHALESDAATNGENGEPGSPDEHINEKDLEAVV